MSTRLENDFALDPADIEAAITPRTKALFLGYPCNPTGAVLPAPSSTRSRDIAVRHDLLVYSDEIYDRLAYGAYRHQAVQRAAGHARADDPDGRVLQGLRDDRLAGRLLCAPADVIEGIVKVHQYQIMSAPHHGPGRGAGGAPVAGAGCPADVAEYDRRRRMLVDGLNAHRPAHVRA